VNTKYVAFVDTDTVFVTTVTEADLFDEAGRPHIIGEVGSPENGWWERVPPTTHHFLGQPEVMRAMAYFPCVYQTDLFPRIRHYMTSMHGVPLEDVFAGAYSKGFISQFNVFANFAFRFAKQQYHFALQEYATGWRCMLAGQIPPTELGDLLRTEDTAPLARVAVHWGYMGHDTSEAGYRESTLRGACYSGLQHPACSKFDPAALHEELFQFERHDWLWDPRCKQAAARHYEHVRAAGRPFDPAALAAIGIEPALPASAAH